ncbi:hypothetical protein BCR44DRAFT_1449699, partial [Catenaria anguillulae PL171]
VANDPGFKNHWRLWLLPCLTQKVCSEPSIDSVTDTSGTSKRANVDHDLETTTRMRRTIRFPLATNIHWRPRLLAPRR